MGRIQAFDYIVIGAGAAGAALANRLTEDPSVSVLLLEAGGTTHRHPFVRMPIAFLQTYRRPKFGWPYTSEPEPALNGRRLAGFRGQALGGSTTVNGMFYTRGNRLDYDSWRDGGLTGWGYADLLPYFKRLETSWRGENVYHGGAGPIHVKSVDSPHMPYAAFEAAAVRAGHAVSDDLYGEVTAGVGRAELSVGGGERSSVARGYLDPIRNRGNLRIEIRAKVSRIVLDDLRAVGVEYRQDGIKVVVRANREVIVSAGTFQSPQILMLSGIGPADALRAVGISPVLDAPGVGQNLQEHPMVALVLEAQGRDTFLNFLRWDRAAVQSLRWLLLRSGAFTDTACYAVVYGRTQAELARPDVQIVGTCMGLDARPWFPLLTARPVHRFVPIISLTHAQSRGSVALRSSDPDDKPTIIYNLLGAEGDLDTLVRGIRMARDIYAQQPQSSLVKAELAPGPDKTSDEALADYVRETVRLAEHPVGTCRMGVDREAVVDAQLRVRGVRGLRVVDASVMPDEPGGNINIPTTMIGEKAADMIRGKTLPAADL